MRRPLLIAAYLAATLMLSGCRDQVIYSGLSQREANEMLALLDTAGYGAKTSSDGRGGTYSIAVGSGQSGAAVRVLTRSGLPREKVTTLTEVLPKDSYMASPSEDRARLAYGLSQELTNTLMQIGGVAQARVHVALAERNALGQVTAVPSASVLIRHNPDVLGVDFQDAVRTLVANSVAGLTFERVAVTMIPDATTMALASAAAAQPLTTPQAMTPVSMPTKVSAQPAAQGGVGPSAPSTTSWPSLFEGIPSIGSTLGSTGLIAGMLLFITAALALGILRGRR